MRNIKLINKEWLFTKDAKSAPSTLPDGWTALDLPYTWNGKDGQDGGNDYYRGTCYFAKSIKADDLPEGEVKYLQFDGVNSSCEVFWNGKSIAKHDGGYSTFRAKIENIKDENILALAVDNSSNDRVYPQNADFTFYGGIYRDVSVIGVAKTHFDLDYYGSPSIMVTPEISGNDAVVKIKTFINDDDNCTVKYEIIADGEVVACEEKKGDDEAKIKIENVHLWNGVKDPYLYTAKATLVCGGEAVDEISTRFGCRTFKIDPEKGFFLNGKEYPLRGVSRHQDRPDIGNALLPEHHKEDIELIVEMGANTIRLAHYQHSQVFYDLCDEAGLVIWAEIPYISRHMPNGYENTVTQMKELIVQNYNHPSIVVWGLSNEITIAGASDPDLIRNHKKLNEICHEMDKTRLTTIASVTMCSIDSEYVHISDVLSYNHYFGWYGGTTDMNGPWFDEFHKKYPEKPIGLSEYGCEALDWHTSNPVQGDYTEEYQSYYHEELIKQIAERPYLWATHVWNMFDFAADARAEGGENGMNHKGLVTFDRKYKKDSFYAYQAWLSDKPMLHLCSKRYVDRVEDVTKVTVYSNCDEVELFANGESVGKQKKGKYPFYYFEVKNEGETTLVAKAGGLEDSAVIRKVDTPNEAYIMKEEGEVINWFDITMPDGRFSINDTIGDIMSTLKGKITMVKVLLRIKNAMTSGKDKDGKSVGGFEVAGFKLNMGMIKNVYGLAKGFTVKRIFSMLGGKFTKEQILEINAMLNKVKKPKKQ
ncbi:MAG: glycoside hydrolase family 2 TIM barrel-domain containing protein [Acutalibacteraceae bacterium]|nr:glycoside hydrolase family 2 TIM barrel-domain containing protein [Acutalibacteraceae bacterium]